MHLICVTQPLERNNVGRVTFVTQDTDPPVDILGTFVGSSKGVGNRGELLVCPDLPYMTRGSALRCEHINPPT